VRGAIGAVPKGDFANHAWGVVDMLAVTDFPDIRLKAAIQSADAGNILLIPREGGYLVRLYVDLGEIDPADRDAFRHITQEQVIDTARRVLRPYTLDVKDVAWFAVYQVGQRVTDRFDDVPAEQTTSRLPRVFIAGDACHTHSAKAGQGMNVSMQDGFNLGWKLGAIATGMAGDAVLDSYQSEREPHVRATIQMAIMMGRTVCITDPAAAAERDRQMLAARAAGQAPDSALSYPPIAACLVLAGSAGAGSYFPQPVAADVRLDDVLGAKAWLLSRRAAAPVCGITTASLDDPRIAVFAGEIAA
jgi:2-polyprenyl-6-methoxyphenol hydroxylase-like FAD-dependent oxidoreductase